MKKVEYIVQKFEHPDCLKWKDIAVYSEDEYKDASETYSYFTDKFKNPKFRLIKRTTTEPKEEVFQETF